MTHYVHQGLLHTVARHSSQWGSAIPSFAQSLRQLPSDIQQRFRAIEGSTIIAAQQTMLNDLALILSTADADTALRKIFWSFDKRYIVFIWENTFIYGGT